MKLAFIMDMEPLYFQGWNDGLKAALDYLSQEHNWEINIYNVQTMKSPSVPDDVDFALFWGAFDKKAHQHKVFKKQGLCFGGGPTVHPLISNFDIVFAENSFDVPVFKKQGVESIQAFGTNTQLFRHLKNSPKVFEAIYPAAFAAWKHHEKFAGYMRLHGGLGLAIGQKQADGWEKECYEVCEANGILTLDWVPGNTLVSLYNASKTVYLSPDAMGGCQRAVLEAKACDIPLVIESDSPRLKEFSEMSRIQILKEFSEKAYGENLKKGIEMILNK